MKILLIYLHLFSHNLLDNYLSRMNLTPTGGIKLNITYLHQKYRLSCEAAALATVLNFYNISVSEEDIIKQMPFDKTKKNKKTWGDPEIGFVGDIDGMSLDTGYGIHWIPMAKLASHWRKTLVLDRAGLKDLTYSILKGQPAVIWVYDGRGTPSFWLTPKGKKVSAIADEHTVVVYGFEGSEDHPMGFYIMDPDHGPTFWDTKKLNLLWESFNHSGLVVQ
jgi:uncharacterized protein YvpB